MLWGIVLIPAAFGLLYYGEVKLVNHGVVFERTVLSTVDAAAGLSGQLVKIKGTPAGEFLTAPRYRQGKVLYWYQSIEEYKETRDSDGDIDRSWETVDSKKEWAPFSISGVKITPDKANPVGEKRVFRGVRDRWAKDFDPSKSDSSPKVGDQRLTVEILPLGGEYFVLGQIQDKNIAGGSSFVVSALDEAGTIQTLKTEYKIMYWVIKGGSVVALWIGLVCLFGPLMAIVGWIPLLGDRLSGLLAMGMLFFSAVVMGLLTLAFKLFWVIAIVAVLVIGFAVIRGIASPRQRPSLAPVGPPTYPPVAPPPMAPPPAAPPSAPPPPAAPPAAPPPPPPG
jgi:hypothetical protein